MNMKSINSTKTDLNLCRKFVLAGNKIMELKNDHIAARPFTHEYKYFLSLL